VCLNLDSKVGERIRLGGGIEWSIWGIFWKKCQMRGDMRVVRDNENAIDAKWGYVLTIQFITENSINLDQESEKKDLHCLKNMV